MINNFKILVSKRIFNDGADLSNINFFNLTDSYVSSVAVDYTDYLIDISNIKYDKEDVISGVLVQRKLDFYKKIFCDI